MKTKTRRLQGFAAAGVLAAAALPALAGDEYAAEAFSGGYEAPPQNATTLIGVGQDDATREAALPFEFPFFGRLHTKVSVCSNGWLAFGATAAATSANAPLPSAADPNGIVAALWDDLTTGTSGTVKTFTAGAAPDRTFVVSWHEVDTFSAQSNDVLSFQVRLHETTGVIEIAYATTGVWDGLAYTAGLEDPTGTIAVGAGSLSATNSGQPSADWRFTPKAVTVGGTLLRDRPVADASGLGNSTETGVPVVGIDLELVRADTGEVAARGRSGEGGAFALTALGADAPAALHLDLLASGEESRVVDTTGAVHRFRLASSIGTTTSSSAGTLTLGASADAANASIRKAVNVQQAARRGFAWARDAAAAAVAGSSPPVAASTFARLDFRFVAGAPAAGNRTAYTPKVVVAATPTTPEVVTPAFAVVHDEGDNPDGWDDDPVLRLAGEHVLASVAKHPGALATRSWEQATSAQGAFADGFAHWFAAVVQGRSIFVDAKTATSATVLDLEVPSPAPARAPEVTGAVAASLWDLADPANETWDEFAGTTSGAGSSAFDVFRTVDLLLGATATSPAADVQKFFDVWRLTGDASATDRAATSRIWIRHGAFVDDAREIDDHAGEERAIAAGTQRVTSLVLSPANEDRFSFDFAPAADARLLVTVAQTTATRFDVEILDAANQPVATATNVGAASAAIVTAATAAPVPAGLYRARVVWRSGPAAAYALAFYEPLRVATASLPEWTAGVNFKEDLAAAGGVAPYVFTTTASVPGLALAESSTRLAGKPERAGTFRVRTSVTDASGTGAAATADLELVVNEALRTGEFFGVPAGETVDADVGRGGTDPAWTSTSVGDGGLVVTDGARLRLSGPSGAPRTFTVTASATDAVGAALASRTTRVLVAPPLPAAGSAEVPAGSHFAFRFDAVGGSRADLAFAFSGTGPRPTLVAIVDATGLGADLKGRSVRTGSGARVSGLRLPTTGAWYAVFARDAAGFTGRLRVAGRVTPPRETHGVVVIDPATETETVRFLAAAGSRVHVELRRELVPAAPRPDGRGIEAPDGSAVALPVWRPLARGGSTVAFTASQTGEHELRIGADAAGPVFWRVRTSPPRRRVFDLF